MTLALHRGELLAEPIAELRALPPDLPERASIAAEAVEFLVSGGGFVEQRRWAEIGELLALADGVDRPGVDWARARAVATTTTLVGSLVDGRSIDVDDVAARLDASTRDVPDDPVLASYLTGVRALLTMLRAIGRADVGPERAMELMADLSASIPGFADVDARFGGVTSEVSAVTALVGGQTRPTERQLSELVDRVERRADGLGAAMRHAGVAYSAMWGHQETDPTRIDLAIEHAEKAAAATGPGDADRVMHLGGLALALMRRAELRPNTADLRAARDRLQEARDLAGGPNHPHWSLVNQMLTQVRELLGTEVDAHHAALEGLRGQVWQALAQDDPAGLRRAVEDAGMEAVSVARACLRMGDARRAATALDLGRGLALFAATASGSLAELLDAAGAHDLADRWRVCVASGEMSGSLRREILNVLTVADGGAALLDPPSVDEIGHALRAVDADALAYLVPGEGTTAGFAVVVSADRRAGYVALPTLAVAAYPEIEDYLTPAADRTEDTGDAVSDEFSGMLSLLCTWAWGAAVRPLIDSYVPSLPEPPSGRPPRLILVPMGGLARVPWQAARGSDGRYAVERIAISQVTSARMLCRTAALPPVLSSGGGLVVGDPDTGSADEDLCSARKEAYAIREVFYRGARYLGRRPDGRPSPSGDGTVEQVAGWLASEDPADGAVAHLACHGFVDASAREPAAYLTLAGGARLHAPDLIPLTTRRPERAIGLVVLSACRSGGSMHGHDEAYSLGSALLAGGVRSVLCTQWDVPDRPAPAFLFMIHHYHRTEGLPAWDALRRAQLWALDRHRTIPATMPEPLHRSARSAALGSVAVWGSVVHWGR